MYWTEKMCIPVALLFLALLVPSQAQTGSPQVSVTPAEADLSGELREFLYDVRANLVLRCELPNDAGLPYVWTKNATKLEEVWEMKDRYQLEKGGAELKVGRALEDDFGNYTCALAGQAQTQGWAVRGRPHLKLPANTNVVEGQKLKLTCKVLGKPYPRVQWLYSNSTDEAANFSALAGRGQVTDSEQGVPDGTLVMEAAARTDAGLYRCNAEHAPAVATTHLRVKDMYAALWPFLGICAEVFILCAIILVYEKRRTKPDLDDSDADNHDQKKS
ncbi:basigin [Leptidea sinapis]|uniref:basigin n=1 Tax=Leptidea sinapis TaxID=189913 RepID=UPI002139D8BA|nr:basigin [Leptidea sinapis]